MDINTGFNLAELKKEEYFSKLIERFEKLSKVFLAKQLGYQGFEARVIVEMKLARIQNACNHRTGYLRWRDLMCGKEMEACILCGYTPYLQANNFLDGKYSFVNKMKLEQTVFEICEKCRYLGVDNEKEYRRIAYEVLLPYLIFQEQ